MGRVRLSLWLGFRTRRPCKMWRTLGWMWHWRAQSLWRLSRRGKRWQSRNWRGHRLSRRISFSRFRYLREMRVWSRILRRSSRAQLQDRIFRSWGRKSQCSKSQSLHELRFEFLLLLILVKQLSFLRTETKDWTNIKALNIGLRTNFSLERSTPRHTLHLWILWANCLVPTMWSSFWMWLTRWWTTSSEISETEVSWRSRSWERKTDRCPETRTDRNDRYFISSFRISS